jgi:glutamate N-acetyltransferase/amino-acid N-acetyltransferase
MIKGVKISTANSGIKYKNRDDLLLVVFDADTNVAGVFTQSSMPAAPINWCKKIVEKGVARALIVNAGNANAFTGLQGDEIVRKTVASIAHELGCEKEKIFVSSTGVIGEIFDAELITSKIPQLVADLSSAEGSTKKAASAIMTTDTRPKFTKKFCQIDGKDVFISGFAKGSGMMAPNMATMLSYIITDADIESSTLQNLLKESINQSFNSITVDSDQSTNDTVLIFATKAAGNHTIGDSHSAEISSFKDSLNELTLDLAKMIVIDGEGAKKLIEIEVEGASTKEQAKKTAFGIANSPLVKTAMAAGDPNWGRIIMATGKSCPDASPNDIIVKIGDHVLTKDGMKHPDYVEAAVHEYLKNKEIKISVNLGLGAERDVVWTCDLNEEYIKINKDYRS